MKLNLVVIRCSNIELAFEWYNTLGFKFQSQRHENGPVHYCHEEDDLVFEIYPESNAQSSTLGVRLGFVVDSIERTITQIKESELGQVISVNGSYAIIKDPDGHTIELQERTT